MIINRHSYYLVNIIYFTHVTLKVFPLIEQDASNNDIKFTLWIKEIQKIIQFMDMEEWVRVCNSSVSPTMWARYSSDSSMAGTGLGDCWVTNLEWRLVLGQKNRSGTSGHRDPWDPGPPPLDDVSGVCGDAGMCTMSVVCMYEFIPFMYSLF